MQSFWQLGRVGRIQSISSALAEQSERDSLQFHLFSFCVVLIPWTHFPSASAVPKGTVFILHREA